MLLLLLQSALRRRRIPSSPVTGIRLNRHSGSSLSDYPHDSTIAPHPVVVRNKRALDGHKSIKAGLEELIGRLRPQLLKPQQHISRVSDPLAPTT
jgi:hypothetical protein